MWKDLSERTQCRILSAFCLFILIIIFKEANNIPPFLSSLIVTLFLFLLIVLLPGALWGNKYSKSRNVNKLNEKILKLKEVQEVKELPIVDNIKTKEEKNQLFQRNLPYQTTFNKLRDCHNCANFMPPFCIHFNEKISYKEDELDLKLIPCEGVLFYQFSDMCLDNSKANNLETRLGLILDIETTGRTNEDELIEIALILFRYNLMSGKIIQILDRYSGIREPNCDISKGAYGIHGISWKNVKGKMLNKIRIKEITDKAQIIISHNVGFDKRYTSKLFPDEFNKKWYCSMNGIKWRNKGFKSKGLHYLLQIHGINILHSHRALDDAEGLLNLLCYNDKILLKPYLSELINSVPLHAPTVIYRGSLSQTNTVIGKITHIESVPENNEAKLMIENIKCLQASESQTQQSFADQQASSSSQLRQVSQTVNGQYGDCVIELVHIPSGEFMMGFNDYDDEKPVHKVKVNAFYMGKYEVTQREWIAVMGSNPPDYKGDDLPVENVSWNDVQEYLQKLSSTTGKSWRLPTEAEWEYACRAGSTTEYCFGDDKKQLGEYAWYHNNSGYKAHPVGQKRPNAWGLYDMHGNVWEWCHDWYGMYYYSNSPLTNPTGPSTGGSRLFRGGSFVYDDYVLRSALRCGDYPTYRNYDLGFRCLQEP